MKYLIWQDQFDSNIRDCLCEANSAEDAICEWLEWFDGFDDDELELELSVIEFEKIQTFSILFKKYETIIKKES